MPGERGPDRMTEREGTGTVSGGDWSAATWEGARREQMRRWATLPLERAILALEEMEDLARELRPPPPADKPRCG